MTALDAVHDDNRDHRAEAFLIEFRTERTYRESVDLFRIGRAEVDANPDGIDLSGPMFEALRTTTAVNTASASGAIRLA